GLYQLRDALRLTTDPELITALVERWRPETNTFHLYHGEATITLEDMHFITGLTVDGLAILEFFGSCIFADRSGAYANLFFLPLLDDLNRVGDYAWDRPHCHGSTESLVVPHFGLRAAPPTITLMTVEAGWRWSRCGLWRDSLL
ncbi:Serine/threonine-protein phosphatase 7 long form homolog, partial [Linum perenne]